MSEEIIVSVDPAPVFDIDPAHIGRVLVCLVAESANLGHEEPRNTLHYGAPDGEPEAAQFVRDAFTLTTGELVEKWYGGQVNATRFANEIVGAAIARQRAGE